MTQEKYTHISFLLDRSGSMTSCLTATITGFNEFIETQKTNPHKTTVSLTLFDGLFGVPNENSTEYESIYSFLPIETVPPLTDHIYIPNGSTALLDAIGKTISYTGQTLAAMKEEQRPNKVLIVIFTDGMENASRKYSFNQIQEMIKHQKEKYNWEFVFIGSEPIALDYAKSLNIYNTAKYTSTEEGTASMLLRVALATKAYSTSENYTSDSFFSNIKEEEPNDE